MIGRFFRYCRKVFHFSRLLEGVQDGRVQPQIPARAIGLSIFLLFLLRLGSLNGLEELLRDSRRQKRWSRLLQGAVPSADAIGYYAERVDCDTIRDGLHSVYTQTS